MSAITFDTRRRDLRPEQCGASAAVNDGKRAITSNLRRGRWDRYRHVPLARAPARWIASRNIRIIAVRDPGDPVSWLCFGAGGEHPPPTHDKRRRSGARGKCAPPLRS